MTVNDFSGGDEALFRYLQALPKAELHLHMEGSIRPELLLRLAERNKLNLPFSSAGEYATLCVYETFQNFANLLLMGVHCLRQLQDFFDVIIDLGESLAKENVRYAEVTWTPQFYLNRPFPLERILEALNEARRQVKVRLGIEIRWITDLVRSFPAPAGVITNWVVSDNARTAGVVALGLGGPEAGYPAGGFSQCFLYARSRGLPANPHAGENAGPASVWETIEQLSPSRLGHGVRSVEDEQLVAYLAEQAIPLEICLTSNIKLGVYASYPEHPVKKLIDAGCVVVLNSDDPALFQTTLTREYMHAIQECGLEILDIKKCILDALFSSYLAESDKLRMLEQFKGEFKKLGAENA
jgi:aminodeoxyfutalosine deaminase